MNFFSLSQEKKDFVVKKFNDYVEKRGPNDCWYFGGPKSRGYGVVTFNPFTEGSKWVHFRAHRLAWELRYKSPIPKELIICHTCDNKACCNPDHLFLGTQRQNVKDYLMKDLRRKLKLSKRLEMAEKIIAGMSTYKAAKMYNIKRVTVRRNLQTKEIIDRYGIIDLSARSLDKKRKNEVCQSAQSSPDTPPHQLSLI